MQEVYEELLGTLKDNPVIGKYLQDELPKWTHIMDKSVFLMLSTGEQALVNIALAMYNGDTSARFSDIFLLDRNLQRRVLNALSLRLREM